MLVHRSFKVHCQWCVALKPSRLKAEPASLSLNLPGQGGYLSRNQLRKASQTVLAQKGERTAFGRTSTSKSSKGSVKKKGELSKKAGPNKSSASKPGTKEAPLTSQKNELDKSSKLGVSNEGLLILREEVLQPEEPAGLPHWNTFASSVTGLWGGVAGAFNPVKGKMEPLAIDEDGEKLFDAASQCEVVSQVEYIKDGVSLGRVGLQRRVTWEAGNAELAGELSGEEEAFADAAEDSGPADSLCGEEQALAQVEEGAGLENDDWSDEDEVEVDLMGPEPGLVFFEDGGYSRGPVSLLDPGQSSENGNGRPAGKSLAGNTFQIEQCLVRGGHRRLRMLHTLQVTQGGADLAVLRIVVFEEDWLGPANMAAISDESTTDLLPFSLRPRLEEEQLAGAWKVFERTAFVVDSDRAATGGAQDDEPAVVYTTSEFLQERVSHASQFSTSGRQAQPGDDGLLLLPGGVSASLTVDEKGYLCIGVGWLIGDGTRLFMNRLYDDKGMLTEVISGTEVLGGWVGGLM